MTTVWYLVVTALVGAKLSTGGFVDQRAANSITSSYTSFATVAGPLSTGGVVEASAAVTSSDLPRQIPPPQSRAAAAAAAASSTPEYDEQVPSLRMVWVTRDPHADIAVR